MGCKGVTIYRDGSREEQVLNVGQAQEGAREPGAGIATTRPARPQLLSGETQRMETGCGKLFVIMNDDEYGPREVFANMGKAGGCASSNTEALGRLIAWPSRRAPRPAEIVEQLKGIRCHVPYGIGAQRHPLVRRRHRQGARTALRRAAPPRPRRARAAAVARGGGSGRLPRLRRRHRARGRLRGVQVVRLLQVRVVD